MKIKRKYEDLIPDENDMVEIVVDPQEAWDSVMNDDGFPEVVECSMESVLGGEFTHDVGGLTKCLMKLPQDIPLAVNSDTIQKVVMTLDIAGVPILVDIQTKTPDYGNTESAELEELPTKVEDFQTAMVCLPSESSDSIIYEWIRVLYSDVDPALQSDINEELFVYYCSYPTTEDGYVNTDKPIFGEMPYPSYPPDYYFISKHKIPNLTEIDCISVDDSIDMDTYNAYRKYFKED